MHNADRGKCSSERGMGDRSCSGFQSTKTTGVDMTRNDEPRGTMLVGSDGNVRPAQGGRVIPWGAARAPPAGEPADGFPLLW